MSQDVVYDIRGFAVQVIIEPDGGKSQGQFLGVPDGLDLHEPVLTF